MIDQLMKSCGEISSSKEMIDKMIEVQSIIGQMPGARFGDDACPLKHSFADGLYIREIFMPKGIIAVSELHKKSYPYFVLEGDLSVIVPGGLVRIKAPYFGITEAGTKRVLYIHEDTHWINVHATDETDVEKMREEFTVKTYDELPELVKKTLETTDKERELIWHSHSL